MTTKQRLIDAAAMKIKEAADATTMVWCGLERDDLQAKNLLFDIVDELNELINKVTNI